MKFDRLLGAVVAMALTPGALFAADAALVIGNADYENAPKALAARADATAIADALEGAGYALSGGVSLNREEMRDVLDAFAARADDADRLVIFYSGHAVRMGGETYLAPAGYDPADPVATAMDGVPFGALLALAAQRPGAAVVIVDAAQLDGFPASGFAEPGLAAIEAPDGVLVVSAAAPGRAIRRTREGQSAFGRAVIDRLLAEGAPVEEAVGSLPAPAWIAGGVDSDLALVEPGPPAGSANVEIAFWQSVENSGQVADYRAYLSRYPDGLFADLARIRLEEKGAGAPKPPPSSFSPEAVEAALGLSTAERRGVQADLTELGYDTRGIDGVFGRGTRGSIRSWQRNEGLDSTGYLNAEQVALLGLSAQRARDARARDEAERRRISAEEARRLDDSAWFRADAAGSISAYQRYLRAYPEGRHAAAARRALTSAVAREDAAAWEEARRIDSAGAYEDYLDRFPSGRHATDAQRRIADLRAEARDRERDRREAEKSWREARRENTPTAYGDFRKRYPDSEFADEARERRLALVEALRTEREAQLGLTADEWISIERRLDALGYDVGRINGAPGPRLRAAIRDYRRDAGMNVHEYVSRRFIKVLVADTSGEGRAPSGVDLLGRLLTE